MEEPVACTALSFTGITPTVMSCCVKAANARGASIPDPPPPSGQASVGSFTFTWKYDTGAQTATVQCTKKPFFVPCGVLNSALKSTVTGCGGTAS
jgi:hypothetical protein